MLKIKDEGFQHRWSNVRSKNCACIRIRIKMQIDLNRYIKDRTSVEHLEAAADLPHEISSQGGPVVSFEGRRLHSAVNPVREAEEWVESNAERILDTAETGSECDSRDSRSWFGVLHNSAGKNSYAIIKSNRSRFNCSVWRLPPEIARKAVMMHVWEPSELNVTFHIIDVMTKLTDLGIASSLVMKGNAGYQVRKPVYEAFMQTETINTADGRNVRVLVPTALSMEDHCLRLDIRLMH